jgi:hypothetical protein
MRGENGKNVGDAIVTVQEFTKKKVSTASGTSKAISGSRSILREVVVNTTLVAAVTVRDGTEDAFVLPAGLAAGETKFYGDVGFDTNINITHSASAGDLTFIFKSF